MSWLVAGARRSITSAGWLLSKPTSAQMSTAPGWKTVSMPKAAGEQQKQKSDGDWSWNGPRMYILFLSIMFFSSHLGHVHNFAQWKDKELELMGIIARLQARVHQLEQTRTDADDADQPAAAPQHTGGENPENRVLI